MRQLFGESMRHALIADYALGVLATRTWKARGGFLYPLHVCAVSDTTGTSVRLVDVTDSVRTLGGWSITEYTDVPDVIRQIGRQDRYFSGLVFHDRIDADGCFWELVHPYTLQPSHMFARPWRERYGI